jgi:hypothetical protein
MSKKRLISFDIGIKNLAYCIFEFSIDDVKIIDWNVLDISREKKEEEVDLEQDKFICSCFLSNQKTKCNKIAKYKRKDEKDYYYYCESHAKKTTYFLPSSEINKVSLKKLSLEKLLEFENHYFPEKKENQKKETKIKKIERINTEIKRNSLEFITISPKKNTKPVDLITIGKNLYHQLILLRDLENIEYVLIENQISPIANKMKTIQGMLAQIFIIQNVPNIEFISSANKLRGFQKEEKKEEKEKEKKEGKNPNPNPNYKQHKKDGILYCQEWLQNDLFCSWNSFFEKYPKKQDDLADSFLQGIWYLQKLNVIERKENK